MDFENGLLGGFQILANQARLELTQDVPAVLAQQQFPLGLPRGIAQVNPHQETIGLGFGKNKGAGLVAGVLGGDDKEGRRLLAGFPLRAHLPLFHGFQQGALGFGRGPVDFIG